MPHPLKKLLHLLLEHILTLRNVCTLEWVLELKVLCREQTHPGPNLIVRPGLLATFWYPLSMDMVHRRQVYETM